MQLSTGSVPRRSARVFDAASFVAPRLKCTASDSNTIICFKETSRSRSRREYVTKESKLIIVVLARRFQLQCQHRILVSHIQIGILSNTVIQTTMQ